MTLQSTSQSMKPNAMIIDTFTIFIVDNVRERIHERNVFLSL